MFKDQYSVTLYEDFAGIPWVVTKLIFETKEKAYEKVIDFVSKTGFKTIKDEILNSLNQKNEYNLTNDLTFVVEGETCDY